MDRDVAQYVVSCVTCSTSKASQQAPAGKLVPLPIPHRPWETIGMDFVGPLPRTRSFHDTILVVVDKLTKMIHLVATNQSVTAQQTAKLVLREVSGCTASRPASSATATRASLACSGRRCGSSSTRS